MEDQYEYDFLYDYAPPPHGMVEIWYPPVKNEYEVPLKTYDFN